MDLYELGWNAHFSQHFDTIATNGCIAGRISREHKNKYSVLTEYGEFLAEIRGKLWLQATSRIDFPAVGDWVVLEPRGTESRATIMNILPRRSQFIRKDAGGRTEAQVLAANIDLVFLVAGLDNDFNLRRIERYLTLVWDSGASPVIVLNKSDMSPELDQAIESVEHIARGFPVHAVSALNGTGIETLRQYTARGVSITLLGSSGVGKSSLINCLLEEDKLAVGAVRKSDGRGCHTTTHRELVLLPQGGILIDTPGIRELQLWASQEDLGDTFEEIETLAQSCRFTDCTHRNEPGCAIRAALEDGSLEDGRLQNYFKMRREINYLERRQDQKASMLEKERWKKISVIQRKYTKKREQTRYGHFK